MIRGLCYSRARGWLLGGAVLALALAGCSGRSGYPAAMTYPARTDPLVGDGQVGKAQRQLPPPGDIGSLIPKLGEDPKAKVQDPSGLSDAERTELRAALDAVFGTPAEPTVDVVGEYPDDPPPLTLLAAARFSRDLAPAANDGKPISVADIDNLELDRGSLKRGSALYRRHCMHCHGVTGDGRGPTGPWVHPHPRDYRQGLFKFVSTAVNINTRKPRRDDLLRTLNHGIDGTSMPAFALMPQRQVHQLVSYVIHLSMRGEVEFLAMQALLEKRELDLDATGTVEKELLRQYPGLKDKKLGMWVRWKATELLVEWANASATRPMAPPDYPPAYLVGSGDDARPRDFKDPVMAKSITNGYKLFLGKGICATCHFDFGRQSDYKFDSWGTLVRPRNLTEGQYRGGRRPLDLFWRLKGGITPSGMSALPSDVPDAEVWDLVHFVQALPYPAMLPDEVRDKIYPKSVPSGKASPTARASHP